MAYTSLYSANHFDMASYHADSEQIGWSIDAKSPEAVGLLLDLIEKRRLFGNVVLCSFDQVSVNRLREGSPDMTATAPTQDESLQLGLGSIN